MPDLNNTRNIPSNILEGFANLLSLFFTQDAIDTFSNAFNSELKENLEKSLNFKYPNDSKIPEGSLSNRVLADYIDRLITFAEGNLDKPKYYMFLQKLGESCISLGELKLARSIYDSIINSTDKQTDLDNLNAYSILEIANVAAREANFNEAIAKARVAAKKFNQQGDQKGIAKAENILGTIYAEQGKLRTARTHFERGLQHIDEKSDLRYAAMFEVNIGITYNISGKFDNSYTYFNRALKKYEELRDSRRIAEVHHNLGMLYLKKEQIDHAEEQFDLSLEISLSNRFLPLLAITYVSKAELLTIVKDFDLATIYVNKGLDVSYNINDRLTTADGYKIKGIIDRENKLFNSAENYLNSSLRINKDYSNDLNYAETSVELALLYILTGNNDKAVNLFNEAKEYYEKIRNRFETRKIKSYLQKLNEEPS